MNIALALVAICLPGGEPGTLSRAVSSVAVRNDGRSVNIEAPQTSVELRIIELPAAAWRESIYARCERVERQGISTVWKLDEATARSLIERVVASKQGRSVQAPKITTFDGQCAKIDFKQNKHYVADIERTAGEHGGVSLRPIVDQAEDGVDFSVTPIRAGGSTKLRIEMSSSWVSSLTSSIVEEKLDNGAGGKSSIRAGMQLPQVVQARLHGSYELPEGKSLLMSLGTCAVSDDQGKTELIERLAIVQPRRVITEAEEEVLLEKMNPRPTTTVPAITRVMPRSPSRSLPVTAVVLPPLPDEAVQQTALHSVPAPLPSLQSAQPMPRKTDNSTPTRDSVNVAQLLRKDPNVQAARFEPIPEAAIATVEAPESVRMAQLLRRDPNVQPATVEPMPVAPSVLLPPTAFAPVPTEEGTTGVVRIPFLGIEIEFKVK